MMGAVNVTANPETQRAARNDIRKVMLVTGEPRDTHRSCKSVSSELHRGTILVFVRNDSRDRPRLRAVPRRKRAAAVEELATLSTIQRPRALGNALQNTLDDDAVDHRFRTQQSRFERAIVGLRAAQQIEPARRRGQTVNRTEIADMPAPRDLTLGFANLIARHAVRSEQRHQADARRHDPLRITALEMK